MNKERLKEILAIPSVFQREELVRMYIESYAVDNDIEYYTDEKGNIYLTKGRDRMTEGEFYPCVVAHMDTVHRDQIDLVDNGTLLDIVESVYEIDDENKQTILTAINPTTKGKTGIGGDDKCGVAVCIEMLDQLDILKAAFFVEEEIGMHGSKVADEEFFKNVGYAIQFDAPSDNWITETCSGVRLFDNDFKETITETLSKDGYTNFSRDPFTDVNQLAQKFDFCCLNLGCGYHRQHSKDEYVVVEEVENAVKAGYNLIIKLGVQDYIHKKETIPNQWYNWATIDDGDDFDDDFEDLKTLSDNITDNVIRLIANGVDRDDIADYVYESLDEILPY